MGSCCDGIIFFNRHKNFVSEYVEIKLFKRNALTIPPKVVILVQVSDGTRN